jgi:hypothetical protein
VPGCRRRSIEAAHLCGCRGMGGAKGDKSGLGPLCDVHHREQEGNTVEFERHYGINLRGLATRLWQEHGATGKYLVYLVTGTPAEVRARWAELARGEVQG